MEITGNRGYCCAFCGIIESVSALLRALFLTTFYRSATRKRERSDGYPGISADVNRYVDELRNALLDATPDITVQRRRDDPRTQDFGATLVLVLGTPAVITAVKTISDWLKLRTSASLTIETPEKRIVVEHIT